jgi:hypothetical protein
VCVDKDHGYYRLECGYLPGTHQTAQELRECGDIIDSVIGYREPAVTYLFKSVEEIKNLAEILI